MKKTLSLILAAVLVATSLSACKDNTNTPNDDIDTNITDTQDNTNDNNEDITDTLTYSEVISQVDAIVEKQDMDKTIVMTVGDYDVSLALYRYYYMYWITWYTYNYGPDWTENADMVAEFNEYVSQETKFPGLIVNLATEKGISLTQKEFDEEIATVLDQIKLQYGEDSDSILYEEFFSTPYFMLVNNTVFLLYNKLFEDFSAPGTENYENIKSETIKFYNDNDYVRAKHILITFPESDDLTEEEKAETLKKAQAVLDKVNAGEDFDKLIEQYNEDPGMKSSPGGYYFGAGKMVEAFENGTRELEIGKTSGLVETPYGYHIIKRLPIDDENIVNSEMFYEITVDLFNEYMLANLEAAVADKAENFDTLIQPIIEEGQALIDEVKAQQEAINITESTEE